MTDRHGLISDQMRSIVGVRFGRSTSFVVSASDIRKWAIAVYYPELPPAYYFRADDAEAALGTGIVAPEDFNPFAWAAEEPDFSTRAASYDPDYPEHALGIEGPGLPVAMNSGLSAEYGARIRSCDVITLERWIESYAEKAGRMGQMLVTLIATELINQDGDFVRRTIETYIRY